MHRKYDGQPHKHKRHLLTDEQALDYEIRKITSSNEPMKLLGKILSSSDGHICYDVMMSIFVIQINGSMNNEDGHIIMRTCTNLMHNSI